jgi:hypothetical protein
MFSCGNITEKMRIAKFNCENQVVLDLFTGDCFYTKILKIKNKKFVLLLIKKKKITISFWKMMKKEYNLYLLEKIKLILLIIRYWHVTIKHLKILFSKIIESK